MTPKKKINPVIRAKQEQEQEQEQELELELKSNGASKQMVPDLDLLRKNRIVAHLDDKNGNAMRVLRSQVLGKLTKNKMNTLAIVGSSPGIGKTTIACNLALAISQDLNQTAMLIDLDLRKPRVGNCLGIENKLGVADHLAKDIDFSDILIESGFDGLVVAPGKPYSNASKLLESHKLEKLLLDAKQHSPNRIVIVDLPPVLVVADYLAALPHVDAVLLVLAEGETSRSEVTELKRAMENTPVVGAVINKSTTVTKSKYYSEYYGS